MKYNMEPTEIMLKEVEKLNKSIENKEILDVFPKEVLYKYLMGYSMFETRQKYTKYSFAVVDKRWTGELAKWINGRKCLEVMSGKGVLAKALRDHGVNLIATDNYSWLHFDFNDLWTNVEKIDAIEAIRKYAANVDIVIMSWAYMDDTAYRVLLEMRKVNPNAMMIFIGEDMYGCTADEDFFNNIELVEDEVFDKINDVYYTWDGIHDELMLIK